MKKKQPPYLNSPSGSLTHFYQLGALLLRKGVKCHSPILQLFSASSSFVFFFYFSYTLYMYLFVYDFNNLKQRQAEYFFFIEILTSVLTIQSYLFLSLNFSQINSLYVLTVIYHEIISMFPYSDIQRFIFSVQIFRSASGFFIAGIPFVKKPV